MSRACLARCYGFWQTSQCWTSENSTEAKQCWSATWLLLRMQPRFYHECLSTSETSEQHDCGREQICFGAQGWHVSALLRACAACMCQKSTDEAWYGVMWLHKSGCRANIRMFDHCPGKCKCLLVSDLPTLELLHEIRYLQAGSTGYMQ